MKNIRYSTERLMGKIKTTNQVIRSRIIDFNMNSKKCILTLDIGIDFIDGFINEMKLAIVARNSEKKILFEGLVKEETQVACHVQWELSDWQEITSSLSISSKDAHILDFYVVYPSKLEDMSVEYSRVSCDIELEACKTVFFCENEAITLIFRPYLTEKGNFSIEIDSFSNPHNMTKNVKTKVLKKVERMAKKYFLIHKEQLEEHPNAVIIKPPKETAFEAKMISQLLSHKVDDDGTDYIYICSDIISEESRMLLMDEFKDRIICSSISSEEYFRYLTTAQFEYSLEEKLQFNSIRNSNVFIKNAVLKKFNTEVDAFQIKIGLQLYHAKQIESIQLELKECDSKLIRLLDAKVLDLDTQTVTFEFKLSDFTVLIEDENWIKSGIVDVRLYIKFHGITSPTSGIIIKKEKTTKFNPDFFVEISDTESFIISPYFEKDAGLIFGTAVVETKIFKKYVLDAQSRMPAINAKRGRLALYYAANYDHTELDERAILYETRNGNSITCSPYAIFKYLINHPEYAHFKHYWVIKAELLSDVKKHIPPKILEKMTLIIKESKAYFDLYLKAKYIIVNGSCLKSPFRKKEGQISINTWHGVPIKHMGFDTANPASHTRFKNVIRQFMALDYLISPNAHTTQVMANAYKLNHLFQGEILEYGYPRMDMTVANQVDVDKQAILGANIQLDLAKPILIYMPTWRGERTKHAVDSVEILIQEVLGLKERLKDYYNILIKVHPFLFEYVKDDIRLKGLLVSDFCDPNEVLSAADVMIADYSSVFFDFIPTRKPIIFYMKDRDEYVENRGLYLLPDNLPGIVVYELDELAKTLKELLSTKLIDRSQVRDEFIAKYSTLADGNATKRVVEHIFKGKKSDIGQVITLKSDKKKVLIKPGTLAPSKTTETYIQMTHNIDFNKYDVTHLCNLNEKGRENIARIHPSVRQMFISGARIYSIEERILAKYYENSVGIRKGKFPNAHRLLKAYQREESRLAPIHAFDYIINYEENPGDDLEQLIRKNKFSFKNLIMNFFTNQKKSL